MIPLRRRWLGSGVIGIVLVCAGPAAGQKDKPKVPPPPSLPGAAGLSSVKFEESDKWRRVLNAGRDYITDKDWKQAIEVLQTALDEKKDSYVKLLERDPIDAKKEIVRWTSVKYEANRLLGTMPAKGLEAYEAAYGAKARTLLDEAKTKNKRAMLHAVATPYRHTKAGARRMRHWPPRCWRCRRSATGRRGAAT
jgi:hypothetical protein